MDILTSLFRDRGGYDEVWFIPFKPENLEKLKHAWDSVVGDIQKDIDLSKIEFMEMIRTIFTFMYPELAADDKNMVWNPKNMKWGEKQSDKL